MSFLNPFLLFGLLAIAIPLVIHLINLKRPKKIRFSTLAFFESLQATTLRRIRIKQILLLSLRVLAVAMLALALAQPFLNLGTENPENRINPGVTGILIDNSPSMGQVDQNGPYLEQVKRLLHEIIDLSDRDEQFFLEVTNGEALNLPALSSSAAKNRLSELSPVNSGNYSARRIARLSERLDQAPQQAGSLFIVSDGQVTQFEGIQEVETESEKSHGLRILTVGTGSQANVAVTGVRLRENLIGQGRPVTVVADIKNFGSSPVDNYFVSLERSSSVRGALAERNGTVEGQYPVSLEPGEEAEFSFEMVTGSENFINGVIDLDGDELVFDNRHYFSVRMPEHRNVVVIQNNQSGGPSFNSYLDPVLTAATASSERMSVERRTWGDNLFSGDNSPDAVILDGVESVPDYAIEQLLTFLQEGGGVLFLPSENGDVSTYNRFLEQVNTGLFTGVTGSYGSFQAIDHLSGLREGHPVLDDIFEKTEEEDLRVNLPELFYHYNLSVSSSPGVYTLLESAGGSPILVEQQYGSGRVMISAIGTDPGWSNFPVKPVFAPLFYRAILYLSAGDEGGMNQHSLGDELVWDVPGNPEQITLEYREQEIVPERQFSRRGVEIRADSKEWTPGFLYLHTTDDVMTIALNQHAMESDFRTLSTHELEELFDAPFGQVSAVNIHGDEAVAAERIQATVLNRSLWYWFIFLAILLLLMETLVGRIYKAESVY